MRRVAAAFVLLLVGSAALSGGCRGSHGHASPEAYREAEMKSRRERALPVIDALERYKAARGEYPEALDALVAEKFLAALPELADTTDHQGQPGRVAHAAFEYKANADRSTFVLAVRVKFAERGFLDTAEMGYAYRPDGSGWRGAPLPERPADPSTAK